MTNRGAIDVDRRRGLEHEDQRARPVVGTSAAAGTSSADGLGNRTVLRRRRARSGSGRSTWSGSEFHRRLDGGRLPRGQARVGATTGRDRYRAGCGGGGTMTVQPCRRCRRGAGAAGFASDLSPRWREPDRAHRDHAGEKHREPDEHGRRRSTGGAAWRPPPRPACRAAR